MADPTVPTKQKVPELSEIARRKIREDISKIRFELMKILPALGGSIFSMHVVEDLNGEICPTAATNGEDLIYNPHFFADRTYEDRRFICVHEVLHKILMHTTMDRAMSRRQPYWNFACDYVVNSLAKSLKFNVPFDALYDDKYVGLAVEQVYQALIQNAPPPIKMMQMSGGGSGNEQGSSGSGQQDGKESNGSSGNSTGKKAKSGQQKKDGASNGQGQDPDSFDSATGKHTLDSHKLWGTQSEEVKEKIDKAAARSLTELAQHMAGQGQGDMPAYMKRLLSGVASSRYSFADQLRLHVYNAIAPQESSWVPPSYKYLASSGIYLPGVKKAYLDLTVAIDTSGSIGQEELHMFAESILSSLNSYSCWNVRIIFCDASIGGDYVATNETELVDILSNKVTGGGGTDFRPVFEKVENTPVLVYLTDGFGTFPDTEPTYPVIWVTSTDEAYLKTNGKEMFPFGEVLPLNKLR